MTKDTGKLCYALIEYYCKLYDFKYNRVPVVNRHREKWAMNDVIDSVGYERAKILLEYYFKVNNSGHNLSWFFYNFDRLDSMLKKVEDDNARRAMIREATKTMMETREAL